HTKQLTNLSREDVLQKAAIPFRLGRPFLVEGCEFRAPRVTAFQVRSTPNRIDPTEILKEVDASSFSNLIMSMASAGSKLDAGEDVTTDILAEADQLIASSDLKPEPPRFPGHVDPNRLFLISSSDPALNQNFDAIRDVCEKKSLNLVRVDKEMSSAPIIDRIHRHLREANFVIADLSQARPNVYYELGYFDAICQARGVDAAEHLLL